MYWFNLPTACPHLNVVHQTAAVDDSGLDCLLQMCCIRCPVFRHLLLGPLHSMTEPYSFATC